MFRASKGLKPVVVVYSDQCGIRREASPPKTLSGCSPKKKLNDLGWVFQHFVFLEEEKALFNLMPALPILQHLITNRLCVGDLHLITVGPFFKESIYRTTHHGGNRTGSFSAQFTIGVLHLAHPQIGIEDKFSSV